MLMPKAWFCQRGALQLSKGVRFRVSPQVPHVGFPVGGRSRRTTPETIRPPGLTWCHDDSWKMHFLKMPLRSRFLIGMDAKLLDPSVIVNDVRGIRAKISRQVQVLGCHAHASKSGCPTSPAVLDTCTPNRR